MPKIEMTVTDAEARQIAEAQAAGIPVHLVLGEARVDNPGRRPLPVRTSEEELTGKGVEALEFPNGDLVWLRDGQIHNNHRPAIERADGTREWYQNDQLHREGGPAVIRPNGAEEWWYRGKQGAFPKTPRGT